MREQTVKDALELVFRNVLALQYLSIAVVIVKHAPYLLPSVMPRMAGQKGWRSVSQMSFNFQRHASLSVHITMALDLDVTSSGR